jgi:hypothetical protein
MPGKVSKEMILWINIVAKGLRTEEGVQIANIRELA